MAIMQIEPGFPEVEYQLRLQRTQRAMHKLRLDALFFTSEAEMYYFTGFRTLFWQSPTRPWFLVIPKIGKPIAIIPEIGAALMRQTWIDDIRTWSSPHPTDDGISLLVDALGSAQSIGVMMGRETSLRMPLADFYHFQNKLPGAQFIDATALIQSIRQVKSEAEIEKIAAICQIASASFGNAPDLFQQGQPLNEVFRAFKIELLNQGAEEVPYLVGGAGQNGYGDVISPPSNAPLQSGDVLMLDTGATLEGYYCDFDRNFAIGHASDAVQSAYSTLYQATEAGLEAARPGVTCAEIFAIMAKTIDRGGSNVGRYGHGLGIQLTETPSIIGFDNTPLQAGMVMTLEPSMEISQGKMMVHEENIVIRDGPPQLLSTRAPAEIPII